MRNCFEGNIDRQRERENRKAGESAKKKKYVLCASSTSRQNCLICVPFSKKDDRNKAANK